MHFNKNKFHFILLLFLLDLVIELLPNYGTIHETDRRTYFQFGTYSSKTFYETHTHTRAHTLIHPGFYPLNFLKNALAAESIYPKVILLD